MADYRVLSQKNKYYLPKETLLTVTHFCKQYNYWLKELAQIDADTVGNPLSGDNVRVQSSNKSDPTADLAIRKEKVQWKVDLIRDTAAEVADGIAEWLIDGVCNGKPYYKLHMDGIPCGKNLYYLMRRRFYFEIAKKI